MTFKLNTTRHKWNVFVRKGSKILIRKQKTPPINAAFLICLFLNGNEFSLLNFHSFSSLLARQIYFINLFHFFLSKKKRRKKEKIWVLEISLKHFILYPRSSLQCFAIKVKIIFIHSLHNKKIRRKLIRENEMILTGKMAKGFL